MHRPFAAAAAALVLCACVVLASVDTKEKPTGDTAEAESALAQLPPRLRRGARPAMLAALSAPSFACDVAGKSDNSSRKEGERVDERSEGRALPLWAVNDGYCDCADGRDEFGTSACAAAATRFHCVNAGHAPRSLPSSLVDDGVCDCCDGSDEGGGACEDTCEAAAGKAREEEWLYKEMYEVGVAKRKKEYVDVAAAVVPRDKKRLKVLKKQFKKLKERIDAFKASGATEPPADLLRDYEKSQEDNEELQSLLYVDTYLGSDNEYAPLFKRCFSHVVSEKLFKGGSYRIEGPETFNFTLCPFRGVLQKSLTIEDSEAITLGVWKKWKGRHRELMFYAGGAECWNGPAEGRTVTVSLACGIEDELSSVVEDGKCRYFMVLTTPAACSPAHLQVLRLNTET